MRACIEDVVPLPKGFEEVLARANLVPSDVLLALALDQRPLESCLSGRIGLTVHEQIFLDQHFETAELAYFELRGKISWWADRQNIDYSSAGQDGEIWPDTASWIQSYLKQTAGSRARVYSDWWGSIWPYYLDPTGLEARVFNEFKDVVEVLQLSVSDHGSPEKGIPSKLFEWIKPEEVHAEYVIFHKEGGNLECAYYMECFLKANEPARDALTRTDVKDKNSIPGGYGNQLALVNYKSLSKDGKKRKKVDCATHLQSQNRTNTSENSENATTSAISSKYLPISASMTAVSTSGSDFSNCNRDDIHRDVFDLHRSLEKVTQAANRLDARLTEGKSRRTDLKRQLDVGRKTTANLERSLKAEQKVVSNFKHQFASEQKKT